MSAAHGVRRRASVGMNYADKLPGAGVCFGIENIPAHRIENIDAAVFDFHALNLLLVKLFGHAKQPRSIAARYAFAGVVRRGIVSGNAIAQRRVYVLVASAVKPLNQKAREVG